MRSGDQIFAFPKKMSEKNNVVFQSISVFNPRIILTASNYNVWSQLVEMYIVERGNFPTFGVKQNNQKNQRMTMKNGMLKIKR